MKKNYMLKKTALVLFLPLLAACNVYNSEPREFINDKAFEQNGRYVISSDTTINESSCLLNGEYPTKGQLTVIETHHEEELSYTIYKVESKNQAYIIVGNKSKDYFCEFNLKKSNLSKEDTDHILDLSLSALEN